MILLAGLNVDDSVIIDVVHGHTVVAILMGRRRDDVLALRAEPARMPLPTWPPLTDFRRAAGG